MLRSSWLTCCLALLVSALAMSCSDNSGIPGEDGATTCQRDDECPIGQTCEQGICTTPGADGDPIPCGQGDSCPSGLVCRDGFCVEGADGGDGDDGGDELPAGPELEIVEPAATGDPPTYVLDFGSVLVGLPVTRSVRVGNTGTQDLRISDLAFENGTVADFVLDPATAARLPILIAPGAETSLDVIYTASDGFNDFGVLDIISNDADEALVRIQLRSEFKGEADIAAEPAAVAFGDVTLGGTARMRVTLSNQGTGNAVLTLEAVQLASVASPTYQLEGLPSLPVYLNRGDVLELDVAYTPGAAGEHLDTLVVVSDDPDEPQLDLAVTGRGVQPDLVVDPAPIQFGLVRVDVASTLEVGIANQGLAPLAVTGLGLAGASAEFGLASDPATGFDLPSLSEATPQVLQPGERRIVSLTFLPADEGAETAQLEVYSPDVTPSPRRVGVSGEGFIPPAIGVDPLQLDFGNVHVRGSRSLDLQVTNQGQGFLEVPDLAIQGGGGTFSVVPTSLPNLGPADSSSPRVSFAPQTIGGREAILGITSNDPDHPQVEVPLLGNAIDPNIFVSPMASPIELGSVYRGQSLEVTIYVTNVGVGPLDVTSISLNAGSSPDFSLVDLPALPAVLASAADMLTFRVLYAPEVVGQDTGAVRIESTDLDAPVRLVEVHAEAVGCPQGQWDVDGDPTNGCEYACVLTNNGVEACDTIDNDCDDQIDETFDLTDDPLNCGACNQACSYPHATGNCVDSGCELGACASNYWDADHDPATGCEYACVLSNNGVEACDTIDNDCDDEVDEDFELATDELNCGACNNICSLFHASAECVASACRVLQCEAPWDDCDGQDVNGCERNLEADPENCNGCGNVCTFPNAPALCVAGVCTPGECAPPFIDCDGLEPNGCETNTDIDEANCGGCGLPCSDPAESCTDGLCLCGGVGPDCNALQLCCGIDCIDPLSDEEHCGDCATACQAGESCEDGGCACGGTGADCSAQEICCGASCFDPLTEEQHCGDCDTLCDPNEGCLNGLCRCGGGALDCQLPLACCGQSCVDLTGDEANCGGCGVICALDHASEHCAPAGCALDGCEQGWGNCDGLVPTGCEANIWQTTSCGLTCAGRVDCTTQVLHATGTACASGACDFNQCVSGFGSCDNDRSNGCEQQLNTMVHCAACNTGCSLPNATATCASGSCQVLSCNPDWGDCTPSPGCETNTASDETHCGDCATTCLAVHGTNECLVGLCSPSCDSGFGDCDASRPNGCEANIWQTTSCGLTCAGRVNCSTQVLNAVGPSCASGLCEYLSCNTGFGDCEGNRTNGCEANLWQTAACGTACGNRVNCNTQVLNASGESCSSGACNYTTCDASFGDCDADRTNGCEASIWQLTSCGPSCATRVNCSTQVLNASGESCASGLCDFSACDPGFDSCDSNRTNGCEANIWQTNSCGTTCGSRLDCNSEVQNATGKSCASGACNYTTCNAGFGDCDANRTNGCEVNIWQVASCGSTCATRVNCGTQVQHATGLTCTGGACGYTSCSPGWGDCDGDPTNGCETDLWLPGACGLACAGRVDCTLQVQHASGETCASGVCDFGLCDPGYDSCDANRANGCELNIWQTSSCGTTCLNRVNCTTQVLNASGETCASGACDYTTCDGGFGNCDSNRANGCELNIWQTNSCGTTCLNRVDCNSEVQNASGKSCNGGACDYTTCNPSFGDCDANEANGCETNIWQVASCGPSCGARVNCNLTVLHASGITCGNGTCGYTACLNGWGDCDGNAANGCETNIWLVDGCGGTCASRVNCNATTQHATGQTCLGGVCDYGACVGGYGDCDGSRPNGCEADLNAVSACGTTCAGRINCTTQVVNATGTYCNAGSCDFASCSPGFDTCDSNRANGCEINTTNDVGHCGSCATVCSNPHGTTTCFGSVCSPSCDTGWDSCDSNPVNGCETDVTVSVNHCGFCGNVCNLPNATEACVSSACVVQSCNAGTWNVDGLNPNGCECIDTSDVGDTCANSPYNVGTIGPGSMIVDRPGVLVYKTGLREDNDCYVLAYNQPSPGAGTLQVTFSPDPGNLRLNVWRGNCSTQECVDSVPPFQTTCYSLPGGGFSCQTGNSNTFYVCVKPATGQNNLCQSYTVRFQRY
ncbi:MAG TPA: choice-of-anchor D domain-containing protein [Myxococcota bacterium]|nr:choice-of-anchor D domain-containing protein [Myxococcota bacterium]HRY95865.1 choice-of-anchor D domain-containing protein [Myxococcota bacterium]